MKSNKKINFITTIKDNWIFLLIISFGILIRLVGIWWNLPKIYHPDEPALVSRALGLRLVSNLERFEWPHLQMYISLVGISLYAKITDIISAISKIPVDNFSSILMQRPASFYLISRLISFLMSSASLIIFYKGIKELLGKKIALVSLLFFVVSLQNIEDAHYATLESGLTFWVIVCFFFSQRIFRHGKLKDYLLAGLAAGLASSTKYNGALATLLIFSAHISYIVSNKKSLCELFISRNLIISAVASIIGFFAGTPYALLDFKTFIRTDSPAGAFWQFRKQGGSVADSLLNYNLAESRYKSEVFKSFGFFGGLVVILGAFFVIRNYTNYAFFLIFFPLTYFWYIGTFKYFYSQYLNSLYPFLGILGGFGVLGIYGFLKRKIKSRKSFRLTTLLVTALIFGIPIYGGLKIGYVLSFGDTRILAENWINRHVPAGTLIATDGGYNVLLDDFDGLTGYKTEKINRIYMQMPSDLSNKEQIRHFRDLGVNIASYGDYDLASKLEVTTSPNCNYANGSEWGISNMKPIATFQSRSFIEPSVVIMSFDTFDELVEKKLLTR